LQAQVKIAFYL